MTLELPALTSEYIRVPVAAKLNGAVVDPTGDVVELAFIKGPQKPGNSDWQTGSWESDATGAEPVYYARVIPSPQLGEGTYFVWIRVHSTPELVIRKCPSMVVFT